MGNVTVYLLTVVAGLTGAGLAWFGWEMAQNILALLRRSKTVSEEKTPEKKP